MCGVVAFTQARPTLGVLPFTGGAAGEGEAISNLFLAQRELRNAFNVVPRNMVLNTIFTERQFQLSDLTDPNTMASLGRMFNANYILSGTITDLGGKNLLIVSIIHVESFEQVAGSYVTYGDLGEVVGLLSSMTTDLVSAATRQRATGRQILATVPFALRAGVKPQEAETLAQILAIEILNTGRYSVVPRLSIMQAALREQGFQMTDLTDNAGMASLGRGMNASLVLGGSVMGVGSANLFMAQILNVQDSRVIEADTLQYGVLSDGIELMGELAIGLVFPPGAQRDEQMSQLWLRQGRPVPVPGDTVAAQLAWVRTNAVSDANYLIQIHSNEAIAPQTLTLPAGRSNVTFTLRGIGAMRTVSLSANGALFRIGSGVTLVLGENITLQGRNNNNNGIVRVEGTGTLIMNAGTEIKENNGGEQAYGGVVILSRGTFIMYGGVISRNNGGVSNSGRFIMHDGIISNNRGTSGTVRTDIGSFPISSVGGVDNHSDGTFTMYGGTISDNIGSNGRRSSSGAPGGVNNNGTFIMYNGIISGNRGGGGGHDARGIGGDGGVYNSGTFTMYGGTISGNHGGEGGQGHTRVGDPSGGPGGSGGVGTFGMFAMHGGTISGNTGGDNGPSGIDGRTVLPGRCGGVAVYERGSFRISNGNIYGNVGSSLVVKNSTAQPGTFNSAGIFSPAGNLSTTTNNIRVVNGVLQ
ncbi:MAG: penicillin-binding protein activator LpoB [Treponema sp.]|nr:penicillin-binding protein activator LpoB [Treponema sp.]